MPVSDAVLQQFRGVLVRQAGGYLRNTIREERVTCRVCSTPVDDFLRCFQCQQHHSGFGEQLADAVGALTYGVDGQQSGYVMYGYKSENPIEEHVAVVAMTVMLGISLHGPCLAATVGAPVTHWTVVPSLRGRAGAHPLSPSGAARGAP